MTARQDRPPPQDRPQPAETTTAEQLAEAVRRIVERAPALDPEQVERLRGLLPARRSARP